MRFIRYSYENNKAIKTFMLKDDKIVQLTIRVISFDETGFSYTTSKSKKEQYAKYEDVLSASYARGDEEGK